MVKQPFKLDNANLYYDYLDRINLGRDDRALFTGDMHFRYYLE